MLILAERDEREMWHIKYIGEMLKILTPKTWWDERSKVDDRIILNWI